MQQGKPWISQSYPVTQVANPKVFVFLFFFEGGDTQALRLELRAWSAYITDLSRIVPDVTCSLTKFWPLHHSFKIAKSVQRYHILRTVTSAAGQVMQ